MLKKTQKWSENVQKMRAQKLDFFAFWTIVTPGSPKGPPRAPQGPPRPHFGGPKGTQGTILEPQGRPQSPKAHQKAPQELNFVSFWDPWAHFCAQASILSTLHFKNGMHGLIYLDVYNVTGCFHVFCCKDVLLIPSLSQDLPRQREPGRRGGYQRRYPP